MNDEHPFEKRLQDLPQRPLPPAWRQEILSAALAPATRHVPVASQTDFFYQLKTLVTALLWPNPRAWAGLAAIWMLVIGLNVTTREPVPVGVAQQLVRPSPQMRELLREQERLLADLVGPKDSPEQNQSKPEVPKRRGERREDFVNT